MQSEGVFRILRHFLFYSGLGSSIGSLVAALYGLSEMSPTLRAIASQPTGAAALLPSLMTMLPSLSMKLFWGTRIGVSVALLIGYVSARIKFPSDGGRRRTHLWLVVFVVISGLLWWWNPQSLFENKPNVKAARSPDAVLRLLNKSVDKKKK